MRILHTSDWHLGRSFHRESLLDAQSAFIDHLVEVTTSAAVDVIVVSGDIYDRALPPVDAVALANDALRRLASTGARIVLTSGNHDSAQRLGFASELIDLAGVHLRTVPDQLSTPIVLEDAYGEVAVYGIPYLEPDAVRGAWGVDGRSHQAVLDEAVRRLRADLATRAGGTRTVVMAHAFVGPATPSDSERDISVGGVSSVALSTFADFDYVALGHLHGRHTLTDSVRYSGSPLAYSFSEARHRKGSWLVDLGRAGCREVEFVDAPVPRRLATLTDTLDALLNSRAYDAHEASWVQATVTDPVRPMRAMDQLRQRFPHALVLTYAPEILREHDSPERARSVAGRRDIDVIDDFFVEMRGVAPSEAERRLLLDACDACRVDADAACLMRVHRLELTAFGPFAERQAIDFDELSDAGIFLLTGKTGAGKTSILDAICFALYGAVPGPRNGARDLKSHHAAPDAKPVVTLDVTMRGRRFQITRTPPWSRPSRRAKHGAVEVHASAIVMELIDGAWVPQTTRLDEAGQLIARVLGMNKDQFCQVVMLPQGQFQSFLRAGAKERHDVLESLFETGRFQRVESWLNERRRAADAACASHVQSCQQLLSRIDEVSDAPLADGSIDLLTSTSSMSSLAALRGRLTAVVQRLGAEQVGLLVATQEGETASKLADHAVDDARLVLARQAEFAAATRRIEELDATADVASARADAVRRARIASRIKPLLDLRGDVDRRRIRTAEIVAALMAGDDPGDPDLLRERRAGLAALGDTAIAVAESQREQEALTDTLAGLSERLSDLDALLASLPDQLSAAREERDAAQRTADLLDDRVARLASLDLAAAAAREAASLEAPLATALDAERAARDAAQAAKQLWLDRRERYLADVAASLAHALVEGERCPVCGSSEHPAPAVAQNGSLVSIQAERAAYDASEAASSDLARAVSEAGELRERQLAAVAASSAYGEGGIEAREAELAQARAAVDDARAAASDVETLDAQLTTIDATLTGLREDRSRLADQRTAAAARRTALAEGSDADASAIDAALAGAADLAAAIAAVDQKLAARARLDVATRELAALVAEIEALDERIAAALEQTEFGSIDEVRAALMSDQEIASDEALARSRASDRAVAAAVLVSPAHVESMSVPAPDLGALSAVAAELRSAHAAAEAALARTSERHTRLEALSVDFDALIDGWKPLLEARDVAASVAAMCAGTAADNVTKTKLSHYVLSARLAQVVAAANVRLAGICGGRYELMHSMDRGVSDARGGLGLRVLDAHTGQRRDPATLSGGETFYVSLALALGLADLVRDEIGGVELATLFVDEGFGSLDVETLDEVLDEIDSLRSDGRCVGLVSHLAELRSRIPMQLQVSGHRDGSVVVGAGC